MQPLHLDVDAITATCLSLLGIALLANAGLLVLLAGLLCCLAGGLAVCVTS